MTRAFLRTSPALYLFSISVSAMMLPKLLMLIILFIPQQGKKAGEYYVKTDNSYEVIDGEKEIVGQTITTFQKPDDRVVRRLNRIYNYKNDPRITELTGLQRTDGLSDYTLDSTFYDK